MTKRDIERARKLSKIKWDAAIEAEYQKLLNVGSKRQKALDKALGFPSQKVEPKKKGGKVDKKGWANGGTVTMPTVGQDTFMRTYKHGAVISPRPRPTVPHGRMRGTGIAKRGW